MDRLSTICFDLDETLLAYKRSPQEVLQRSFERCEVEPFFSGQDYYDVFDAHIEAGDTIEEIRAACFAHLAEAHAGDPQLGRTIADAYTRERDQSNVELYPGVEAMLESLSGDYPLGIITNGLEEPQSQKIAATGIERWFDVIVYAGDGMPAKPSPEPFQRAVSQLDADVEEAIHVGNSLESDIKGAAGIGMRSVWVSDGTVPSDVRPDYHISEIADLLDLPPFR